LLAGLAVLAAAPAARSVGSLPLVAHSGFAGDRADSLWKDSGFRVVRIAGLGHQT